MGFDDQPWAAVCAPPLSVVRQPARRIGQVAAEMLRRLTCGEPLAEPRVPVEGNVILRQSCCASHAPQPA